MTWNSIEELKDQRIKEPVICCYMHGICSPEAQPIERSIFDSVDDEIMRKIDRSIAYARDDVKIPAIGILYDPQNIKTGAVVVPLDIDLFTFATELDCQYVTIKEDDFRAWSPIPKFEIPKNAKREYIDYPDEPSDIKDLADKISVGSIGITERSRGILRLSGIQKISDLEDICAEDLKALRCQEDTDLIECAINLFGLRRLSDG